MLNKKESTLEISRETKKPADSVPREKHPEEEEICGEKKKK